MQTKLQRIEIETAPCRNHDLAVDHAAGRQAPEDVARQIVVGGDFDPAPLEEALTAQAGRKVQINLNPTAARRVWLEMAAKNARFGAQQAASSQSTQETRLAALQQALELGETLQRIECFDVSHTMGEATVASCVVYDKSAMQKSEYRRYNIRTVGPGDDYGAMREVLTRRYRKIVAGEGKVPDLVMIDGGKGQLGIAVEVFSELGLSGVPLMAVAGQQVPYVDKTFISPAVAPALVLLGATGAAAELRRAIKDPSRIDNPVILQIRAGGKTEVRVVVQQPKRSDAATKRPTARGRTSSSATPRPARAQPTFLWVTTSGTPSSLASTVGCPSRPSSSHQPVPSSTRVVR